MNLVARIDRSELAAGALAGAIGGACGALAMNLFQWAWSAVSTRDDVRGRVQQGGPLTKAQDRESATERAAGRLLREPRLANANRRAVGVVLHYLMGAGCGGVYGASARRFPALASARGAPFGAAIWLAADETAVPLLGLSRAPDRYPVSTHVMDLCAHLVYGMTTDWVCRRIQRTITDRRGRRSRI